MEGPLSPGKQVTPKEASQRWANKEESGTASETGRELTEGEALERKENLFPDEPREYFPRVSAPALTTLLLILPKHGFRLPVPCLVLLCIIGVIFLFGFYIQSLRVSTTMALNASSLKDGESCSAWSQSLQGAPTMRLPSNSPSKADPGLPCPFVLTPRERQTSRPGCPHLHAIDGALNN